MHPADEELHKLASTLADWAHPHTTIYLFGSRVRGDHRPDSDVDVVVVHDQPSNELVEWWTRENSTDFAGIDAELPGPLRIEPSSTDAAKTIIEAGKQPVYVDRNVICVWFPPKSVCLAQPSNDS